MTAPISADADDMGMPKPTRNATGRRRGFVQKPEERPVLNKWKLVPVEPTPEMIKAGADVECIITGIDEIDAPEVTNGCLWPMLEAAPA